MGFEEMILPYRVIFLATNSVFAFKNLITSMEVFCAQISVATYVFLCDEFLNQAHAGLQPVCT